ncbi:MAG: 2Fe-2S iron-sulfur cluster-binding protein [Acidocella sp.]|nr:2Fe-2S iron-sulfur cluster-binding protein [Acidocella sp.]
MSDMGFTVNGKQDVHMPPARMHLADYLRETLHLTGTHIGCEHGVCGACTLLVDGEPVRSCIMFATACEGRDIRSIEGLETDKVTIALRAAFTSAHALQCGYCTPGMLVTARDIILRLPDADDARIRLELAGNLCRCTGYEGIVRAIRVVLDAKLDIAPPQRRMVPVALPAAAVTPLSPGFPGGQAPIESLEKPKSSKLAAKKGSGLVQHLRITAPRDVLWQAMQDPVLVASCIPGAAITSRDGDRITGEMAVALGPIEGKFIGFAVITYGDFAGTISGEGQDRISKTRLSAQADFTVRPVSTIESLLELNIQYSLRGALAQFARGAVVQAFADEISSIVAQNLQAKLTGGQPIMAAPRLSAMRLFWAVLWRRFINRRK